MNNRPFSQALILALCAVSFLSGGTLAQTDKTPSTPIYLDPSKPLSVRVDDLVSRMTLEEKASQLVNQSRAIPRLKVPPYDWRSEALHGVAGISLATVFPEPIGLAATFDTPLIHKMAEAIGMRGERNTIKPSAKGDGTFWRVSIFGLRTLILRVTQDGAGDRKLMAKIPSSPEEWRLLSSLASRAMILNIYA